MCLKQEKASEREKKRNSQESAVDDIRIAEMFLSTHICCKVAEKNFIIIIEWATSTTMTMNSALTSWAYEFMRFSTCESHYTLYVENYMIDELVSAESRK